MSFDTDTDHDHDYSIRELYDMEPCCPQTMKCPVCKDGTVQLYVVCHHDYGGYWEPSAVDYDIDVEDNDCGCTIDEQYIQTCYDTYMM